MKRYLQIFAIALIFSSCGEKAYIRDLQRKPMDENKVEIFYKGKPFTGTAWTDDEKTAALDVNKGKIVKIVLFYPNGKKAYVASDKGVFYFDKEEKAITPAEFIQDFPNYEEKFADIFNMQETK